MERLNHLSESSLENYQNLTQSEFYFFHAVLIIGFLVTMFCIHRIYLVRNSSKLKKQHKKTLAEEIIWLYFTLSNINVIVIGLAVITCQAFDMSYFDSVKLNMIGIVIVLLQVSVAFIFICFLFLPIVFKYKLFNKISRIHFYFFCSAYTPTCISFYVFGIL